MNRRIAALGFIIFYPFIVTGYHFWKFLKEFAKYDFASDIRGAWVIVTTGETPNERRRREYLDRLKKNWKK